MMFGNELILSTLIRSGLVEYGWSQIECSWRSTLYLSCRHRLQETPEYLIIIGELFTLSFTAVRFTLAKGLNAIASHTLNIAYFLV